jgi:hypothetical protein
MKTLRIFCEESIRFQSKKCGEGNRIGCDLSTIAIKRFIDIAASILVTLLQVHGVQPTIPDRLLPE